MSHERKLLKPCLATVTDSDFLPGTLIMLHSFLKTNHWFKEANGDIVIIHDELPQQSQELFNIYKNVIFMQAGEALKKSVDSLCRNIPELKLGSRKKRFYSLEMFRLKGYSHALFCDSDILFLGDISDLFQTLPSIDSEENIHLSGVGDLHYFSDVAVDAESMMPVKEHDVKKEGNSLITNTFNAGFFIVDGGCLTSEHYNNLLGLLEHRRWKKIKSSRTDQVVLNLYFRDKCRMLSARYNYLVLHSDVIERKEKLAVEDIKVLHFNGKAKPWDYMTLFNFDTPIHLMITFVTLWHREYLDLLSQYHLHRQFVNKIKKFNKTGRT